MPRSYTVAIPEFMVRSGPVDEDSALTSDAFFAYYMEKNISLQMLTGWMPGYTMSLVCVKHDGTHLNTTLTPRDAQIISAYALKVLSKDRVGEVWNSDDGHMTLHIISDEFMSKAKPKPADSPIPGMVILGLLSFLLAWWRE
jgi:hypothetical protein